MIKKKSAVGLKKKPKKNAFQKSKTAITGINKSVLVAKDVQQQAAGVDTQPSDISESFKKTMQDGIVAEAKATKLTAKGTYKVGKKIASGLKKRKAAVKTAKTTAKATVKTAQKTAQATKSATKVTVQVAKTTAKIISTAIAKITELIMAAGGWIGVVIFACIAVIIVLLAMLANMFSITGISDGGSYSADGTLCFPFQSEYYISSDFGERDGQMHNGIDISCNSAFGKPIYAAESGVVILAESLENSYGNHIIIQHGDDVVTHYAHLQSYIVFKGDTVTRGKKIGYCGSTGNSTGPHLHFEVQICGVYADPKQFFQYTQG